MTKARQRERKKKRLAEERGWQAVRQINRTRSNSGASLWEELADVDARLLSKFGPKDEYTDEEYDAVSDELAAEFEARSGEGD